MPKTSAHAEMQPGLEFVVKLNDFMNEQGGGTEDLAEAEIRASNTSIFVKSMLENMTLDEQAAVVSSLCGLSSHARDLATLVGISLARRSIAELHRSVL